MDGSATDEVEADGIECRRSGINGFNPAASKS